ncbi:MAG: DNA-binding protein WhiA [Clostridia bacterium]|nr:DNA-binding protein WhiA [Clostridia bacterium]MBN2882359.1 DNA-binding protein WhiA [Clostridia bacterium]
MSFSAKVKNELCRIENTDKCCAICEISAVIRLGAVFSMGESGHYTIKINTENAALARRIITEAVRLFDFHPSIAVQKTRKLRGHTVFTAELKGTFSTSVALGDMGFLRMGDDESPVFSDIDEIAGGDCCEKAYLRGAFLASGSVSAPDKGYHLEISSLNVSEINRVVQAMESFGIKAKKAYRKKHYICYVKDAEGVADFLNLSGAHKALMEFENIRVLKNVRNNINRVVNFETANLNKTVDASIRQCEDIKLIIGSVGLGKLSEELIQMAQVRLENPEASLEELGSLMDPPIGKSGANHRLAKLSKIAEDIRLNGGFG